ncbi:hyaluronidase-4 [Orycteropus afer afer]|uniref:Hyaluronidase n=1 Tax=Orycteropus afer afer TaxID=1230840 RepID=A0A8B7AAD9_ORYAF|nr:hyaluronidase-4 [Orycteropus afer afer]
MCNLWVAWLRVLLLFTVFEIYWTTTGFFTHPVLKPTVPPVVHNQPFNIFWAAPTMQCKHFFNVDLHLQLFNIIANPLETQSGSTITIFYPNQLGYYPYFSNNRKSINGGIPQNMSLSKHLKKTADDIAKVIPLWRSEGLVVIDWENWKPQWDRNWGNRIVYKKHSLAFTRRHHPDWSEMKVKTIAQQEFENAGRNFMNITLTLALEMRPRCLWGFYLYPDCYNYDYRINPQSYTGNCPSDEIFRNDQLQWLWEKSSALYPSIYLDKILKSSLNALKFVHYRVYESMRISTMTSHDYALPVFVYTRLGYRDEPLFFLSKQDLIRTIGESAALGAAGIVIWGDMNLTSSEGNCTKVKQFVSSDFGRYIVNVTRAAEVCSRYLCRNNGRCIRKRWKAPDYLHLSSASYHIETSEDGDITVTGKTSDTDLEVMAEKFSCHCYQGYEGADCREMKTADGCAWVSPVSGSLLTLYLLVIACGWSIQL